MWFPHFWFRKVDDALYDVQLRQRGAWQKSKFGVLIGVLTGLVVGVITAVHNYDKKDIRELFVTSAWPFVFCAVIGGASGLILQIADKAARLNDPDLDPSERRPDEAFSLNLAAAVLMVVVAVLLSVLLMMFL